MLIDIVILPPKSFRNKFGKIGRTLQKKMPAIYAVDNKKLIPHLSLFHLSTNKINKVFQVMAQELPSCQSLKIYPTKFGINNIENKYLNSGLEIRPNKDLQFLHESVVNALYRFKNGSAFTPKKYYTPKQEYYRTKFGGNPNMLEFFHPHFTLANFKIFNSMRQKQLKEILKVKFLPFIAKDITVARTDKNHQVIKILKTFKLK